MMKRLKHFWFWISLLITVGCVDPYEGPSSDGNVNILVVDGFLDASNGTVSVSLTRAQNLSEKTEPSPEINAIVTLQAGNQSYALVSNTPGIYEFSGVDIVDGNKYTLLIKTANQKTYTSDEILAIRTPPIDSITWSGDERGVSIQVTTHDPTNQSQHYRWDAVETWQYNAPVSSDYKIVNKEIIYREISEGIYVCWQTIPINNILIGSTARLSQDVIYKSPLTFVQKGSTKISSHYSILVRQRAISKEEYNFLDQLKRTTESVGGLFDPMPSQVTGNMHGLSDPGAPVLGYFSAGYAESKRLFIQHRELPRNLKESMVNWACVPDTIPLSMMAPYLEGGTIIGTAIYERGRLFGYTISTDLCADCRYYGGVTTKPSFWP